MASGSSKIIEKRRTMIKYNRVYYFRRLIVTSLAVVLLAVVVTLCLTKEQAYAAKSVMGLNCESAVGFTIDLGVDPVYTDRSPMIGAAKYVTTCKASTIDTSAMLGCIFVTEAGNGPGNTPGRYVMTNERGRNLEYLVYANFRPNSFVFEPPSLTGSPSINTGLLFESVSQGRLGMNWTTGLDLPKNDRQLRYVPAGTYYGKLLVDMYAGDNFKYQTYCNLGSAGIYHFNQITVITRVTITKKCTIVSVGSLDFGQHARLSSDVRAYGSVDIGCNNEEESSPVPFTLKFNNGQNATASGQRRMKSGSNYLDYDVFYQSNQMPVGDVPGLQYSGRGSQRVGIIGRIRRYVENIPAGQYTDTILLTLEY